MKGGEEENQPKGMENTWLEGGFFWEGVPNGILKKPPKKIGMKLTEEGWMERNDRDVSA